MFKNRALLSFMLLCACMLFAAGTTSATTFTVTNTTDCATPACGSLRQAINDANIAPGADTIDATGVTGTITLTSGQLNITDALTINGPGANQLIVSGNDGLRIFQVGNFITATISGLTIANGSAGPTSGGGIQNYGTLTLIDCTVSGNKAQGSNGGGIFNARTMTIINSTISGNVSGFGGRGGGIFTTNGTLTVINSTISGNSAAIGGGIFQESGLSLNISNSTIVNNSATNTLGGGLAINGTANVKNTIIANQQAGADCVLGSGTLTASGVNYSTDGTCTGFTQTTSAALDLGALALNAPGTTSTHALGTSSVAINAATDCTDLSTPTPAAITTDQRGVARPQGTACDAGSYEVEVAPAGTALTALGPARMWIGLKNSDDVGIRFDLRAEAYRGTDLVGSGVLASVVGGSSGFNNAKLNTIPMSPLPDVVFLPGEQLKIKVLVRNACKGSGKNSGSARLWFNDAAANSRFDATIGTASTYYLRPGSVLTTTAGTGPKTTIDVAAGAKCSLYKSFGIWSITLPGAAPAS